MSRTWYSVARRGDVAHLAIYSDIEADGANAFANQIAKLGNVREIRLSLNSPGGDIAAGTAIFNLLSRHKARKVITVDGVAASMASVIFMAGHERIMPKNAMLMIHHPWGIASGGAAEIVSFGEALEKMGDNIISAYADATGQPRSKIEAMMDKETWLNADESLELGFATKVVAPQKAVAAFNWERRGYKNLPFVFSNARPTDWDQVAKRTYSRWNSSPRVFSGERS